MTKEILVYSPIYSWSAEAFMSSMEAAKAMDVCARICCDGGDTLYGQGMVAKWNEHPKAKSVKVDGAARSMAAYFACNADDVECLETSEFLFHRAAFPAYIENDPVAFTPELKAMITSRNDMLKAMLLKKVDASMWATITGCTIEALFSLDGRKEVTLKAQQAKTLGIVNKIVPLTAAKKTEINANAASLGIAAFYDITAVTTPQPSNTKKMTLTELKAQHADLMEAYKTEVLAAEADRVNTWMLYAKTDMAAVTAGIASGKVISGLQMNELIIKGISAKTLEAIKAENAEEVVRCCQPKQRPT